MALNINGTTGISGVDGSASAPALQGTDSNTGINFASDTVNINTGGSTRATIDSSGALDVPTDFPIKVGSSEKLRISSSGQIGIGKVPSRTVDVEGKIRSSEAVCFGDNSSTPAEGAAIHRPDSNTLAFVTNNVERCRINDTGRLLIGTTDTTPYNNTGSNEGVVLSGDSIQAARSGDIPFFLNRLDSGGGTLAAFYRAGGQQGTISVSGSTVSYNGGHLSRWSQIKGLSQTDKSARPEIYQGTVMSNLDDLCVWDGEDNQQLNMTKISDTEGDKDVAGVFYTWDDDDDKVVNDFYIAMTGDMVIRVAASTTVARGDLLISAGDGTAKPQADDIVRSSTIAKIISTTSTATYADGSKAYPCVLMAC